MTDENNDNHQRMQIKVLYSFNNNPTVFLSRSKSQYSVKTIDLPSTSDDETITLGAFDLRHCISQILNHSPENFHLHNEDYAVYYKDLTEQPDEPFVAQGSLTSLVNSKDKTLVPGRVCRNLSASFLFGDKSSVASLTLEIRLKLHTVEKSDSQQFAKPQQQSQQQQQQQQQQTRKRPNETHNQYQNTHQHPPKRTFNHHVDNTAAAKATRTKSLPIFTPLPPTPRQATIMNSDRSNVPSRYDSKSVQDRFKSAPFLQERVIDKPLPNSRSRYPSAMRTRSMVHQPIPAISSPIEEEGDSSDPEYKPGELEQSKNGNNSDDSDDNDSDEPSPYTPQQPPYNDEKVGEENTNLNPNPSSSFQSLPDLEELDSKRTHTISRSKLPHNHGLICTNPTCATNESITWRYFETSSATAPKILAMRNSSEFDKRHYEGMFGPLCNACYLFLRNKGFMRPEPVVKKYLQQQKYKEKPTNTTTTNANTNTTSSSLDAIAQRRSSQIKPMDINDIMSQLNSFGGPLTDIDPVISPPVMATKSNTRVINMDPTPNPVDDHSDEDKENIAPPSNGMDDFESILAFNHSSPWISSLFEKDELTPVDMVDHHPNFPPMKTFKNNTTSLDNNLARIVPNMPSSPYNSDEITWTASDNKGSTPTTEFYSNDDKMYHHEVIEEEKEQV
ncbi:uncharacterized protein SPAPADRAFT_66879 [Spathaspora passalidarum NRRL Y-27907]|uniref:GATA-type domain-containing protein n=1 Tax=Spathaspora passalidarum (strain NRRL Y-27907 / 11-Y1) TaxID=619300 RepID=G3APS1_SPAPN|nr:uncharacterized protein SPAPADRAFT_66879 [Spathaspora passalidarum NRRL Y-27907]EGW32242.1 hypothetical protein SPAPADRAFT_66879 [Spathaspora passalidarum NRRL Y-27907]